MSVEDLLKLQIAFNHILEDRVDTADFTILDKYGFIRYNKINGVQYIQYPNKKDVKDILNDINKNLK
jgi:hypothetical protein